MTKERYFSFTVLEGVERHIFATLWPLLFVHRGRSLFVLPHPLLQPFSSMVVEPHIHASKFPFPLMRHPHAIWQRVTICMVSSRKQNSSYGMKLLCKTAIVQRQSIVLSKTFSNRRVRILLMFHCLEVSQFSLLVTSDSCLLFQGAPESRSSIILSANHIC